jgi:hypothetical protein
MVGVRGMSGVMAAYRTSPPIEARWVVSNSLLIVQFARQRLLRDARDRPHQPISNGTSEQGQPHPDLSCGRH